MPALAAANDAILASSSIDHSESPATAFEATEAAFVLYRRCQESLLVSNYSVRTATDTLQTIVTTTRQGTQAEIPSRRRGASPRLDVALVAIDLAAVCASLCNNLRQKTILVNRPMFSPWYNLPLKQETNRKW
jgi:hypothetical protein